MWRRYMQPRTHSQMARRERHNIAIFTQPSHIAVRESPTDLSNQDRNETAPTLRNRHQHDSNTKPPHSSMSFHPFAFCLFTPTLELALTLFCGPVPFISVVSSPSTLTALGRRLLFVTLGLAFALVPWLPPPLVLVPC